MFRTLEAFQSEWFENKNSNSVDLSVVEAGLVPNVYAKNELLNDRVTNFSKDNEKLKAELNRLKDDYEKLAKERDFHRMHHRRITQEKDKLVNDIKRQTHHYKNYEPALKDLKRKYESAMKEKMLSNLERDRAVAHLNTMMETQKQNIKRENTQEVLGNLGTGFREDRETGKIGPTQHNLAVAREEQEVIDRLNRSKIYQETENDTNPKDSDWPADRRVNPKLASYKNLPKFNFQNLKVDITVSVSDLPISSIALHPNAELAVTASDDKQWYLWSVPCDKSRNEAALDDETSPNSSKAINNSKNSQASHPSLSPRLAPAQLQMSGTGHSDWISSVDFHPSGSILATGSGDATVRIWDLENNQNEIISFNDHQNAIWDVKFHSCGDFLASCSMDTTAKIWDMNSYRCRATLRGHSDSINSLEFLDFSNTLLTGSADKTLKLWDARTHLCAHTYHGHTHSINSASFSKRGDKIVSTDSFGIINIWDVRNTRSQIKRIDLGIHAGNSIKYHPSGHYIVVACADGSVKVLENLEQEEASIFTLNGSNGHNDSVNDIVFGYDANSLFTCCSEGNLKIWRV